MTHKARNDDVVALVASAARAMAAATPETSTRLDPERIWWRAQLTRKLEAERRAMAPLDVGASVAISIASFASTAIGIWFWRDLDIATMLPAGFVALALATTGFAGALGAWRLRPKA